MQIEDEIVHEFVEESLEHLSGIELQLVQIEAGGETIDDDLVNTVFRSIHSIKGAAGFLGLQQINQLSHSFENVLGRVREHQLIPDPFNVNVMLQAADQLAALIDDIQHSDEKDQTELCRALDALIEAKTPDVQPEKPAGLSTGDAAPIEEAACVDDPDADVVAKGEPAEIDGSSDHNQNKRTNELSGGEDATSNSKSTTATSGRATEQTIRVNVKVLDRLMNLAGELVLSRNRLMRTIMHSPKQTGLAEIGNDLDHVTTDIQEVVMQTRMQPIGQVFNKFPRIIRDLSSKLGKQIELSVSGAEVEIDKTIIEAIGDPLTHLIRNCCDHAIETPEKRSAAGKPEAGSVTLAAFHQAGKVIIEIRDDGAGMDPEALKNKAIDRGILTVEAAAEMSDHDAIHLIFAPGFSTAETISDVSGRGVGMDVVRTNIEKIGGTVEVTSKFGVGSTVRTTLPLTLAIVPAMIVEVNSQCYALPQSSIIEMVQTDGAKKVIEKVNGSEVLRLRGQLYPMVRARDILETTAAPDQSFPSSSEQISSEQLSSGQLSSGQLSSGQHSSDPHIVLVETGSQRFALAVDRVLDSEDIVVKPLGRHLRNVPLLAGSTILGDGKVALILDASGIQSKVDIKGERGIEIDSETDPIQEQLDAQKLIILSVSPSDRFGVSMDIVKRIERIEFDRIENVGARQVLQYRGGTLPLLSVSDAIEVSEKIATREHCQNNCCYVVIFDVYGHEVGLIAPQLHDIVEIDFTSGVQVLHETGVAGIIPVDGQTTRLIDLYGMTEHIRPEWFEQRQEDIKCRDLNILVCEDSNFFRNFLCRVLRDQGHTIHEAEDGQQGFDQLLEYGDTIDMVITDVEMPRMNGFELTRAIRGNNKLSHLPVVALTSKADDESFKAGQDAGVDDYQVKMNKPALLASIASLSTKVAAGV